MLKRPEEAHALEEAEEERRIAERGQRAPTLATRKMKKMKVWTLRLRFSLAR